MSRLVYIGIIDDNVERCKDRILRTSEERTFIRTINPKELTDYEQYFKEDNSFLKLFVPFLNQYSGWCAYVHSDFVPDYDIDVFFTNAILQVGKPIVHYTQKDIWIFNCADPLLKELNPHSIKHTGYHELLNNIGITVIDKI